MDPVTFFLIASTATAVAGSVQAANASKAAGTAAMRTAEYNASIRERNAKVADNEADAAMRAGGKQVLSFTEKYRQLQAQATTQYASSGVTMSGTPLNVLLKSDTEAFEEKQAIRFNAAEAASKLREQGKNQRLAGQLTLLEGSQTQQALIMQSKQQRFKALQQAAFGGYRYSQIS
jgi:hypothetical protein